MEVNLKTSDYSTEVIQIDNHPDECPCCYRGIVANYLDGYLNKELKTALLAFFCPRADCSHYFIGEYEWALGNSFYLKKTLLGKHRKKVFSEVISNISSDFAEIYNQALTAEEESLHQICGVGYRKALEFLIKDYIIYMDESLKMKVEKLPLAKCIDDYIRNDKIKNIAKRATWLGNDETHYVRKWVGKSITELKLLIDLTVHWIETEDLTEKMIASMPEH